jgi:hypothetical protein
MTLREINYKLIVLEDEIKSYIYQNGYDAYVQELRNDCDILKHKGAILSTE